MLQTKLQMFVASPTKPKQLIFFNLREKLKQIDGHEDVLVGMLEQCRLFLELEIYVTPDDKYRLLRSLPHLILLIDGTILDPDKDRSFNVFKQKPTRFKLDPYKKLFKLNPVLPLYGDMPLNLSEVLRRAPHYDDDMDGSWGADPDKRVIADYDLTTHWMQMRQDYDSLMGRLTLQMKAILRHTIILYCYHCPSSLHAHTDPCRQESAP